MSTSFECVKHLKHWFACTLLVPICISQAVAEEPVNAEIMPKANKSLLIDVEKVGDNYVVVGERGHILLSSDRGKTWQQSPVPMAHMLTGVSFADDLHGWAVGYDGNIVATEDGGKSWVLQRDGLGAQAEYNVRRLRDLKAKVAQLNAKLMDTSISADQHAELKTLLEDVQWDLEGTAERVNEPVVAQPLLDVWFENARNGWAVGAFGKLLHTTDGGKNWIDKSNRIDNEMEYHLNSVTGIHGGTVIVTGEAGFMIVSQDNGKTWYSIDLGYDGTLFSVESDDTGDSVVATGLRGTTFISEDKGMHWKNVTPDVGFSLSGVEFVDSSSMLLVGHGGTVSFTDDGGQTYITETLPTRAAISNAAYIGDGKFILVGQGGVSEYTLQSAAEEK